MMKAKDMKHMRRMVKVAIQKLEAGCDFPEDKLLVLHSYGWRMGRVLKAKAQKLLKEHSQCQG